MDSRTILIADDDPLERKLLRIRLTQMGFRVVTAQDGVEALEKARQDAPDLIVADILMPRLDGFRLCQAVRQSPELASVPVVLNTSASVEEADRLLARALGANAFVLRTPECREITDAIQQSLSDGAPVRPPEDDTLVAGLRAQFLTSGSQESRALLEALESEPDPSAGRQLAHRWAGVGGTLGFPQISQRAYEIEKLLERPLAAVASQLRGELEEIARLFRDAAREPQQGAVPPPEVVASLSGKRIALLGLEPSEVTKLARALEQARACWRDVPLSSAPPGSPALQAFDLIVLFLCPAVVESPWADPQAVVRNDKPLLVIGPRELLLEKKAAVYEHAADFLLSPWYTGEVVLRASRILSAAWASPGPAAGIGQEIRVVVADDDLTVGALLIATLRGCGIQCQIARHGAEALELTRRLRPHALILDVMMPHLDGFQVLAALKNDPATRHIPVVLLTARQQEADIVRGFALGAQDYMVKPFNPVELVARLKRLIRTFAAASVA